MWHPTLASLPVLVSLVAASSLQLDLALALDAGRDREDRAPVVVEGEPCCAEILGGPTAFSADPDSNGALPDEFFFGSSLAAGEHTLRSLAAAPHDFAAGSFRSTFVVRDSVPEPATSMILGIGLAGLAAMRRGRSGRARVS